MTLPPKQRAEVLGRSMAYVEVGSGDPVVLLHGNPTSSYLWRNVIPHLADLGRCIAPDLIGMGDSDKLPDSGPGSYTFAEHARFLTEFLEAVGATQDVTLVLHDWGSALGFDWASRHPEAVKAIAYMEGLVRPMSWEEFPDAARDIFKAFRTEAGEAMILERNLFVEAVLPGSVLQKLPEEVMAEYRRPFAEPGEGRRPTLAWPRQLPIAGEPADVVMRVNDYAAWLASTNVPKLFVNADPGAILTGAQREFCRSWPNQKEVTVAGVHFVQEDSGEQIGKEVATWLRELQ